MIRTRFAPSPTGFLHIGVTRTALFNYLFAKKNGGKFVMRIEDTDKERSKIEFEKDILEGLQWLGITWDEGPDAAGSYGPYRQSERTALYREYLEKLSEKGMIYECFCTIEELEQEKEAHIVSKQPPKYSGRCRKLSDAARKEMKDRGVSSTLRFKVPESVFSINDLVRGELTFDTKTLDDFVIAKNFDTVLFNFAVVVDDYLMGITHVIRGEDHISNIPKHIMIARALAFTEPQFAHLPMILNPDRSKLSKRENKVSLNEYKHEGYLPESIINFIALLGWNPGTEQEFFTLSELEKIFSVEHVHKAGAIFDLQKLDWFNAHYIRGMETKKLTEACTPFLQAASYVGVPPTPTEQEFVEKMIAVEKNRLHTLKGITENTGYYFSDDFTYDPALLAWKDASAETTKENLTFAATVISEISATSFTKEVLEGIVKEAIVKQSKSNGEVLWPLRVALSGLKASPSPFEIAATIGKEKTLIRIKKSQALLS